MARGDSPIVIWQTNTVIQMHQHRSLNFRCGQTDRHFAFVILGEEKHHIIAEDSGKVFDVTNRGRGEMSV